MPRLDNGDPSELRSIPVGWSEREHVFDAGGACWCSPELEHVCGNGAKVWVHHDLNGANAPFEVIAEAIAIAAFDEDEQ